MWEASISLCEQLYEASLVLLDIYGTEPSLCESQVKAFMRTKPYRDWWVRELFRIKDKQKYFPESEYELAALSGYAHIMADVMLRVISKADYIESNYDLKLRQN